MGQRLGQHFLINNEKLENVAKALGIRKRDIVIEVGPGHGELTQYLLDAGAQIIALERDTQLIPALRKKFAKEKFTVIGGNALETLPIIVNALSEGRVCLDEIQGAGEACDRDVVMLPRGRKREGNAVDRQTEMPSYKIAGNIPYYITGYLLRVIEELEQKPTRVVMTIQKEVAERICAKAPQMNLLAASVQFWANPDIVESVPKKDFNPPPKVDSATIRLDVQPTEEDSKKYYTFIKKLFTQPRKTIANNLTGKEEGKERVIKILNEIGIDERKRPQDLSMEEIVILMKKYDKK
ncbi:MAG: dimethyladenosine transferase [uncultured bacterium]|uniref:Ribosomal RNA small subunit methyltransferase A n=1 Tax=Candidatus Wolfebacteria bacterium GW2011_GWE2_44_13 TaxID=1619017 RepID=A0A0G1JFV4_9BACT|nr:MAG: dimethyladenosine transferase [uncultured bacterium]KKT42917.1 MAG: Ribosomal RNA small subunit methyltransferase A [Candidatus Wolfebacteria bacterium GW2011_GWE2_44_13]